MGTYECSRRDEYISLSLIATGEVLSSGESSSKSGDPASHTRPRPLHDLVSAIRHRKASSCESKRTASSGGASRHRQNSCWTPPISVEESDLSLSEDGQCSDGSVGQCSVRSFPSEMDVLLVDSDPTQQDFEVVGKNSPDKEPTTSSFTALRTTYLLVTFVIMLADGLQGTHLYVLYESYGFSVAWLYCLGFVTGGLMSPITGPLVDRIGRKKSAILYCVLEILINVLEQYPFIVGLIVSRMIGGFTTNLLSSVFETWLDTEYRRRGFAKEKYEIVMRDSVITSNVAAIFSGYVSHMLALRYGAVGPFEGAVAFTAVALVVVCFVWTENYGSSETECTKDMMGYLIEAVTAFKEDRKMLCVGVLQGFTAGAIHVFVFLWAPTLRQFASSAPADAWFLDSLGEPVYGLIFGAFMGAGVLGGLVAPYLRQYTSSVLSPLVDDDDATPVVEVGEEPIRPMAVEFLAAACYVLSALMLFVPCLCPTSSSSSFSISFYALLTYEFLIGVFLPCEGVIRSLYFPANARASIMALPCIVVNAAVAVGVVSTNFVSLKSAFFAVGCLMVISSTVQLSLVSDREWSSLFKRYNRMHERASRCTQSLSFSAMKIVQSEKPLPPKQHARLVSDSDWSICSSLLSKESCIRENTHKVKTA